MNEKISKSKLTSMTTKKNKTNNVDLQKTRRKYRKKFDNISLRLMIFRYQKQFEIDNM